MDGAWGGGCLSLLLAGSWWRMQQPWVAHMTVCFLPAAVCFFPAAVASTCRLIVQAAAQTAVGLHCSASAGGAWTAPTRPPLDPHLLLLTAAAGPVTSLDQASLLLNLETLTCCCVLLFLTLLHCSAAAGGAWTASTRPRCRWMGSTRRGTMGRGCTRTSWTRWVHGFVALAASASAPDGATFAGAAARSTKLCC